MMSRKLLFNSCGLFRVLLAATALACPFAADVAYAQFLHDASEIALEDHGKAMEQTQDFYRSGNEGISYFRLPAVKPDVLIPVIEVILKEGM